MHAQNGRVASPLADYVRSLGLDAWVVGGAVRDELLGLPVREHDFVVPGVGHAELRAALEPHGKVDDLVVAEQRIGVRLIPRDRDARKLQPAGLEFTPPRVERSTGPGRHDFEIVADRSISLAEDMERRDFTVNAMARRLETGELLDPLGGQADLENRILRTTSPTSFRDDPLRIVRGLRFVSQLDLDPDEDTLRQMREWGAQIEHVSAERIGGGLASDGMGELSKLLLGSHPAKALRLARDTGVLEHVLPELAAATGYVQDSPRQHLTLDEHVYAVVQLTSDAGDRLEVRLCALLHDLGKPESDRTGADHAEAGATIARRVLRRLRYPRRLEEHVTRLVREHAFHELPNPQAVDARRFLARHGEEAALDLLAHKAADMGAKDRTEAEHAAFARFRRLVASERSSPHRLADLAIDGADLIAAGFEEGPELGRVLALLLADVVEEPERNERDLLLARAAEERS
jgi:tRNA nucleotidyltransferase (CCA-adding enzyme)